MNTVLVNTAGADYPIHIASGLLARMDDYVPANASSLVVVSNPTVLKLYGSCVLEALARCGKPVHTFSMPDGEAYKTQDTLTALHTFMLEHRLDRKSVMVALGGGVVGDLAGFAAATFMRGIRFIQVPTTLLAQVDSSVGGKTAINHPLGKNMIGAFYQPIAVVIDIDVLGTLGKREISAGLAEVVKYGMIMDADFFAWCEEHVGELNGLQAAAVSYAVQRSCELKAKVVSLDEKEGGLRAILNFGHTFAHAIEGGLGYGQWLHGEAVGCGMIQAACLSHEVAGLDTASVDRIARLVAAIGCPVHAPDLGFERWMDLMRLDKKSTAGQIHFVVLDRIGHALVQQAPDEVVARVIAHTVG